MTPYISSRYSVSRVNYWSLVVITCFLLQGKTSASIDCKKCPSGTYVEKPCDGNVDTVCKPCSRGTYNHYTDLSQSCSECSVCDTTQIVTQGCTPTTDTVCVCPAGQLWKSFGADGTCVMVIQQQHHDHDKASNPPVINSSGRKVDFTLLLLLLSILYAIKCNL